MCKSVYDFVCRTYKHTHTHTQSSLFIHLAVQATERKARETEIEKGERWGDRGNRVIELLF